MQIDIKKMVLDSTIQDLYVNKQLISPLIAKRRNVDDVCFASSVIFWQKVQIADHSILFRPNKQSHFE